MHQLRLQDPRVWLCEICEQAPAHVTCKADDPFYDSMNSAANSVPVIKYVVNFLDGRHLTDVDGETELSRKEAEATSWLLPNPKAIENPDLNSGHHWFQEMDPYLDLDYGHVDPKLEEAQKQNSCDAQMEPTQLSCSASMAGSAFGIMAFFL